MTGTATQAGATSPAADATYGDSTPAAAPIPSADATGRGTPTGHAGTVTAAGSGSGSRTIASLGWGGLALTALLGLTSGLGGVLMFAGIFAFVVAAVALARGRVRWAHLPTRAAGGAALVGSLVAMSVGASVAPAASTTTASTRPSPSAVAAAPVSTASPASPATSAAAATTSPTTTATPTTSASPTTATDPVAAAIDDADSGTALALLGTLTVKGRAPMTGYSRAMFGAAWTDTDRNGCDQRNDTLRRDLKSIRLKAGTRGCTVMTGTLADPYTGNTVKFIRTSSSYSPVQIDHVVPLADAWVKGAARWEQAQRSAFANDTLNLLAVGASINASKGAGDAATWLPPVKSYRCTYIARQVGVKAKYHLAVTKAERAAMANILTGCPTTKVPSVQVAKLGGFPLYQAPAPQPKPAPQPAPKPSPKPSQPSSSTPSPIQGVHPGAFCSPEGALGYTNKGTLMKCSTKPGDTRARWRSA